MTTLALVRMVLGASTATEGSLTYGLHLRTADGVLTRVALTAETSAWQWWEQAWDEATLSRRSQEDVS